jgi:hypothetical protein
METLTTAYADGLLTISVQRKAGLENAVSSRKRIAI